MLFENYNGGGEFIINILKTSKQNGILGCAYTLTLTQSHRTNANAISIKKNSFLSLKKSFSSFILLLAFLFLHCLKMLPLLLFHGASLKVAYIIY